MKYFLSFLLLFCNNFVSGYNSENELKIHLLTNYSEDILPNNESTNLRLGLALRALNNINQIDGTLTANIWLRYWWNDSNMKWNPVEWGGITNIIMYSSPDYDRRIWVPDMYLYNTAEIPLSNLDMTRLNVYYTGDIIWSRPGLITSTCSFDLSDFPYDQQNCNLRFGSWVYHSGELNLSKSPVPIDLSNYQPSGSWDIISTNTEIEEKEYLCCPEKYQTINFIFKIRRKPGYYNLNIIMPAFATATLMILSLIVPWDSGERISFAMTVMLSIIVFLLILSENLPKSDTKPLLSQMLIGLIFFSLFVVFFTVFISYMHTYTKKKSKLALKLVEFFKRMKLIKCDEHNQDDNELNRTDSYMESVNPEEIEKQCDKVAYCLENIFTAIFILSFTIYCICVFSLKPSY